MYEKVSKITVSAQNLKISLHSKMFDDKSKVFRDECARSMSVLDGYYEPLLKRNRGHFVSDSFSVFQYAVFNFSRRPISFFLAIRQQQGRQSSDSIVRYE